MTRALVLSSFWVALLCVDFATASDGGPQARDLKEGERIMHEAEQRFGVSKAVCAHRLGSLEIGELAVIVGVSSPHRSAAFAACRFIIDEVKQRVPIWKKEHYEEGDSGWVNCEQCAAPTHAHD